MPEERIRIGDDYYLLASSLALRRPQVVLNDGDTFVILDHAGDVPLSAQDPFGLFHRGTRHLSRFELQLNGGFLALLSSAPNEDETELVTFVTNADERRGDQIVLLRDTLAVQRRKVVRDGRLQERVHLHNYGRASLHLLLQVLFEADFRDIFELRGVNRPHRGQLAQAKIGAGDAALSYQGLDGITRATTVSFSPAPRRLTENKAEFDLTLAPGGEQVIEIGVQCDSGAAKSDVLSFDTALESLRQQRNSWRSQFPALVSDRQAFNEWLTQSLQDLAMLRVVHDAGSYVYAGIPWFATVFGRDGIITALETLPFEPSLAAGVLRTLAALQGREDNELRDEEPGKIVHEMRHGEMPALGEVPFARYYGSVDATPLFIVLLAEYAERTADLDLVSQLWPAAVAAMRWIEVYGDRDGDGYLEYARRTQRGLVNQGWKDSHDAVFHEDGTLAEAPIALAEVQAYVYAAQCGLARLARRLEREVAAATWEAKALALRERFLRDFWMADHQTFALALDRDKRPCRVVSSNAGHCLFGEIADRHTALKTIDRLMREDVFCGWGIRTVSAQAARYNPMSYHNGSVWPHDNAMVAAGFSRYGANEQAAQILGGLFNAVMSMPDRRLPELFCGFKRSEQHSPVPYPVACKPQAWAAGCVFMLVQSMLGLRIDAWERRVRFDRPALPAWLGRLEIRGLRIRDASLDLLIERGHASASIEVLDRRGDVEVVVRK